MEATTSQRFQPLTAQELKKLQKAILGYGKLAQCASAAGLHTHTLRSVARNGYGVPDTINALRKTILA